MTHRTFFKLVSSGIAAALLGTGCAPERATAPEVPNVAAQQNARSGGSFDTPVLAPPGTTVPVVQRGKPLDKDIVITVTVTPRGGLVHVGTSGLLLYFAPGAVQAPLTVTATAHAGSAMAYSFEPHGTAFHAPVYVIQSLIGSNVAHSLGAASTIAGAYMPDGLADLSADGLSAQVSEIHEASVDKTHDPVHGLELGSAVFAIQHFSGYILTGGRR